jgi:acyl carrier protein
MDDDRDIYDAGFNSIASLELLIELETIHGVTIPDDQFVLARTPRQLRTLVERLGDA